MPFTSKAQVRKFRQLVKTGEISQATFDRFETETPNMNRLPERVGKASKRSAGKRLATPKRHRSKRTQQNK